MMRKIVPVVLVARGLAVPFAPSRAAVTYHLGLKSFHERVGKAVAPVGKKPSGLCVCQEPSPRKQLVGCLGSYVDGYDPGLVTVKVVCAVERFDRASGERTAIDYCDDFAVLPN